MKIKFFDKSVKRPRKEYISDSGVDLFIPKGFSIKPLETKVINLGIGVSIPEGFVGMLIPRSSIATKGLIIQTPAIDPEYNGEIHLILTNCSKNSYTFKKNERLCSLVCVSILNLYFKKVTKFEKTDRGKKGMGSSGK